jgi:hypothetical protein
MPDQEFKCKDCGTLFLHTHKEQEWMKAKWGDNYGAPSRCKICRKKRRDEFLSSKYDERPLHD